MNISNISSLTSAGRLDGQRRLLQRRDERGRVEGGNTTWYHTQGDDRGAWGWVPAVDLQTPDALDANPAAVGLAACR